VLGGVYVEVYPIALFKDGRALSDTTGLLYAEGLEAHRAKFPGAWTQWRRSGTDLQVLQPNGSWKTADSGAAPLAGHHVRRAGVYEALSVASSPSMSIVASTLCTFTNAGAFGRGRYAVGDTANVGAISTTPDKRGTYAIDGYRLTLSFENGSREEHVIVLDPRPEYLYIDGTMYSSK